MPKTPLVTIAPVTPGSMQLAGKWHVRPSGQTYFTLEAKGLTKAGEPFEYRVDSAVSTEEDVIAAFTQYLQLTKELKE